MTGIPGCCARAASGQAAAPPSSDMKSRRSTALGLPCFSIQRIAHRRTMGDCCAGWDRSIAGVILMQYLPFADAKALAVYDAFERGAYQLMSAER